MKRNLTELNKLENFLKTNGFVYRREDSDNLFSAEEWRILVDVNGANAQPMDRHQIIVFKKRRRSWDVICQFGSFGADEGLLEGMGDIFGNDVEGCLTADDVIKRIEEKERTSDDQRRSVC